MGTLQINPDLKRLTPKQFQKWFENRWIGMKDDWKIYYEKIGGKVQPGDLSDKPKKKKED